MDKPRPIKNISVINAIKTEVRKGEKIMENREFTKEQVDEIQKGIEKYQELVRQNGVLEERNKHLLKMMNREKRDTVKNVKIMFVLSIITASASLFLLGMVAGKCLPF